MPGSAKLSGSDNLVTNKLRGLPALTWDARAPRGPFPSWVWEVRQLPRLQAGLTLGRFGETLARRGCSHVTEGGGLTLTLNPRGGASAWTWKPSWPWFTVTAAPGMWGQQARRARLLPLIFICSTVCFAFQSLAEHEALDTPWMAQGGCLHFFFSFK